MFDEENILRGPELPEPLPEESMGVFCYTKLKELPEDRVLMTEAHSGNSCTAREFLQLSVNVAAGLGELGVGPGDIVCLVGENDIKMNATAIGVMFLGAIWSPLDASLKSFEYQHLLNLFEPKLVVCDQHVFSVIKEAKDACDQEFEIICLEDTDDGETKTWENMLVETAIDDFEPTSVSDNEEVAVMIGSSGTTGLPKGVSLTHKNLIFIVIIGKNTLGLVGDALFIHTSHFFWISGVFVFLMSVCLGMRRVLVIDATPENVLAAIEQFKGGWGLFAPSLVNGMVHHPDVNNYDVSSMRAIITAGSALNMGTYLLVKEIFGDQIVLAQAYGLSELSGCYSSPRPDFNPMSVGSLNPGTALKIVDPETGNIQPPGQEGEVQCHSLGMMKEYHKNPEVTAATVDEDGWLHTGDIGYVSEKGEIFLTGRMKELLKLDNHQIAPAEIEQVIHTVAGVADVAVTGIKITEDNSYPMAIVVKEPGSDVSEEEIIKAVNENLSEFKQLRGGVCFVDKIPRTSTGKVKRLPLQELANELYMGDTNMIL